MKMVDCPFPMLDFSSATFLILATLQCASGSAPVLHDGLSQSLPTLVFFQFGAIQMGVS